MTTPYHITALDMGTTNVPSAEIYWMEELKGWEPLAFWALLIENDERKVLLNTGFARDYSALEEHWAAFAENAMGERGHIPEVGEEHWIVNALAEEDVAPEEIDDVFVTPLTSYATGGLDQFPEARVWMSRRGWVDFHAPDPEVPQLPRPIVFPPHVLRWLVLEAPSRIHLLPDEESEPVPGVRSWFCGGHHRSSMAFVVETAAGRVGVTDAIFKYRNYEESIPLGLSESVKEHYRLYAKMERETDLVVPLYDPQVAERHPSLRIGPDEPAGEEAADSEAAVQR